MMGMEYSLSLRAFAEAFFWASAAVLFYVYAGYPLLLAVLALLTPRPRPAAPADDDLPFLSILIAAYNEAASIGKKIQETLALDYPANEREIIVLSDGSTDRTDSIVKSVADPHVRLL